MRNSAGPDDAPDTAPDQHVRPRHVAPLRTANDRTARLGLERPRRRPNFTSDLKRHRCYPAVAMVQVLAVIQVLLCMGLVALILMHSGRDAGLGGMGFTPASQGGTHIVERNLTRLTVVIAILFVTNSILLFHALK
jgi:preprotein translocase subunit SecG